MKSIYQKILTLGCIYYTAGTILLFLALAIFNAAEKNMIPNIFNVILLFPFFVALAAARELVLRKPFSAAGCRWAHYGIVITAFMLFLWLPSGTVKTVTAGLVAILLVSMAYWSLIGIVALTKMRYRSIREED